MNRTSVLVVGAGPTGLTLAIELARRAVEVRVIDRTPEFFVGSRGKGLAPRSHEVLHNLGVLDAIERVGYRHFPHRRWFNGELVSDADPNANTRPTAGTPYDSGILLPQWRVEHALRDALAELGVTVELGAELAEFSQSADGVRAVLAGGEQIEADYLVGCDGGRSTVRKAVGGTFEGESGQQGMLVGDVRVEGLEPDAWQMWTVPDKGFVALCPFRDWSHWQFQGTPLKDFGPDGELPPPSLEYFQRIFDDIAEVSGVRLSDPTWLSTYRVNVRMVDRFRHERVFLAGDAAHVHSPAGGLGMNTGIQDAHNLGWKLALVLSGRADPALLDTYDEERIPVARWTLGVSTEELRSVVSSVSEPGSQGGFQPSGKLQVDQLALGYAWSSLATDAIDRPQGPKAGDRAPDSPCTPTRLFDVFRTPWFTLLGFGAATRAAVDTVTAKHPDLVLGQVLATTAGPGIDLVDAEGHAHRDYAITEDTLILIRPDGHLGLTAAGEDSAAVLAYLGRI